MTDRHHHASLTRGKAQFVEHYVHLLYNLHLQSIFGCFIFLLVVKIAPPVKGGIMDNVIVKDNKASRES